MQAREIVIHPLAANEVDRISGAPWPGGLPERHRRRVERQRHDEALYLVAWLGAAPAGHLLLVWAGSADEPMASQLTDCAEIQDFVVRPDLRSHGIGRQLLAVAEGCARQRALRCLGLYVGLENPRARAFYARVGFADAGFGTLPLRWLSRGTDGESHWHEEEAVYLIKELR